MPDNHRHTSAATTWPATPFDLWFAPLVFWANWWSLCEEALHVTQIRLCPAGHKPQADGDMVEIEVEEGLVA